MMIKNELSDIIQSKGFASFAEVVSLAHTGN